MQNEIHFFLIPFRFCIKGNQIWHKHLIIHDTIHGNDKVLTSLVLYSTKPRQKRRAKLNNTSSDIVLEVSFSI